MLVYTLLQDTSTPEMEVENKSIKHQVIDALETGRMQLLKYLQSSGYGISAHKDRHPVTLEKLDEE